MITEVEISKEIQKTVATVIGEFRIDMNGLLMKLTNNGFFKGIGDETLILTSSEAAILKGILHSQIESISNRIYAASGFTKEAPTLIEYYNQLLQDLEQVKFTDNVL
jgi:hypothetical protein